MQGKRVECEHKGLKSELQMAGCSVLSSVRFCFLFPLSHIHHAMHLRSARLTTLLARSFPPRVSLRLNQFHFKLEPSFTRRAVD